MNTYTPFLETTRQTYMAMNSQVLNWILSRSNVAFPFLDTKFHPIELRNYTADDALRGPDYLYGWIQGRGLEALVLHARYFTGHDPALAAQLMRRSEALYTQLDALFTRHSGAAFCYDADHTPICTAAGEEAQSQQRDTGLATFSDLFVVKGLIAASTYHAVGELPRHLEQLEAIIEAIRDKRFFIDESSHITHSRLAVQANDFGPRMIAIGAASTLHKLELSNYDTFSHAFVDDILERHLHPDSGLLANTPHGSHANLGHAIELVGFYLETHHTNVSDNRLEALVKLLAHSFEVGFNHTGIRLTANVRNCIADTDLCPWWSLPETIRAAALAYELTGDTQFQFIWSQSHNAFLEHFWRSNPPVAFQMMNGSGPVDRIPATPDLDPAYHTGLSLLAAIEVAERLQSRQTTY
jgi:hypothetical protein